MWCCSMTSLKLCYFGKLISLSGYYVMGFHISQNA
jgi:hypothetical protein